MDITLIGGGWDQAYAPELYGPFLSAASARAGGRSRCLIGCVVVDEGDGVEQALRWTSVIEALGDVAARAILVPIGSSLSSSALAGIDALLVCGGLTPAYAEALAPVAEGVRRLVRGGLPYAGFSAGAAVAARRAVVGGWRLNGTPVCDPDAAEDLDEVEVVDGLGLVEWPVDVHASQWGTVPRLAAALQRDGLPVGYAIDEDTALRITDEEQTVVGAGAVHRVTPAGTSHEDRCATGRAARPRRHPGR